jgi:hypothetical protein
MPALTNYRGLLDTPFLFSFVLFRFVLVFPIFFLFGWKCLFIISDPWGKLDKRDSLRHDEVSRIRKQANEQAGREAWGQCNHLVFGFISILFWLAVTAPSSGSSCRRKAFQLAKTSPIRIPTIVSLLTVGIPQSVSLCYYCLCYFRFLRNTKKISNSLLALFF